MPGDNPNGPSARFPASTLRFRTTQTRSSPVMSTSGTTRPCSRCRRSLLSDPSVQGTQNCILSAGWTLHHWPAGDLRAQYPARAAFQELGLFAGEGYEVGIPGRSRHVAVPRRILQHPEPSKLRPAVRRDIRVVHSKATWPVLGIAGRGAGQITTTQGKPRQIQFALRVEF